MSSRWATHSHLAAKVRARRYGRYASRSDNLTGRPKDSLYEPALQDSEREAVADLLQYLEQVTKFTFSMFFGMLMCFSETRPTSSAANLYEPSALLFYSDNVDLQRSASLTFAEITERGMDRHSHLHGYGSDRHLDVREVDRNTLEPILFMLQCHDIEVQRAASAALGKPGGQQYVVHFGQGPTY